MKKTHILRLIIVASCFFICVDFCAGNLKNDKKTNLAFEQLKEFRKRGGLPNFYNKIKNTREVKVAYLGGSITEAREGWRTLTYNWLRVNYPETIFTEITAAIGGTGSNLGVSRVEHDVLQHKPDLLFVEFAVNDKMEKHENVLRTMEGIIRKTWKVDNSIDICFIYTMVEDQCEELLKGELSSTIKAMEKLADYYNIPSIHVGKKVVQLIQEDKLVFTADPSENVNKIVFTKDHTHPLSESGHPIYGSTIVKYLKEMESFGKVGKHKLKKDYVADNWQNANVYSIVDMVKTGNWELLREGDKLFDRFSHFMPAIYKGSPGAKLSLQFKGTAIGLYDILGPGSGKIKVTIDGKERKIQRFDSYCSYNRLSSIFIEKQMNNTLHKVEIEVLDEEFDKEEILSKRDPKVYQKDKLKYAGYNYFIGNIIVVGEGIK